MAGSFTQGHLHTDVRGLHDGRPNEMALPGGIPEVQDASAFAMNARLLCQVAKRVVLIALMR